MGAGCARGVTQAAYEERQAHARRTGLLVSSCRCAGGGIARREGVVVQAPTQATHHADTRLSCMAVNPKGRKLQDVCEKIRRQPQSSSPSGTELRHTSGHRFPLHAHPSPLNLCGSTCWCRPGWPAAAVRLAPYNART